MPKVKKLDAIPMMFYCNVAMRKAITKKSNREDVTLSEAVRRLVAKGLENENQNSN